MPDQSTPPPGRSVNVSIQTKDGILSGKLTLPAEFLTFGEFAYLTNGLTDQVIGLNVKLDQQKGHTISCRQGCAHCCRQLVPISPPEAFLLADIIDQQPPEIRQQMLDRFDAAANSLSEYGLLDRLLPAPLKIEEIRVLAREYFAKYMDCPFLVDEQCSIYPFRPTACRSYLVTTPAELCSKVFESDVRSVPNMLLMSRHMAHVYSEATGAPPELVPLPAAMIWVRQHAEQRLRAYKADELINCLLQRINTLISEHYHEDNPSSDG